jgi:hypothetical protein
VTTHWAAADPAGDCQPEWTVARRVDVEDLPDISEWNDMTDTHRDLYERPLARAHALAEQWSGDQTPITRSEAAELLYTVLDSHGWTQAETAAPTLTLVTTESASACPSDCDDDCDADCHEDHAVPWKRHHDPATCPSRQENQ